MRPAARVEPDSEDPPDARGGAKKARRLALGWSIPPGPRRTGMIAALTLLALVARLYFVLELHPPRLYVMNDMFIYDLGADRILAGTREVWDTYNPVGYPAFLALLYALSGKSHTQVGVVQAFLSAATVAFAIDLAHHVTRRFTVALLVGVAMVAYFPLIFYTGFLLTESLCCFLVTAGLSLLLRSLPARRWWLAAIAGVAIGLATTTRANLATLFPMIIALGLVLRRTSPFLARAALIAMLAASPILAAASLRNSLILGRPAGLSTNAGINLLLAHSRYASVKFPDGDLFGVGSVAYNRKHFTEILVTSHHAYEDQYFFSEALRMMREDPSLIVLPGNILEGCGLGRADDWPNQVYYPGWMNHGDLLLVFARGFFFVGILPAFLYLFAIARDRPLRAEPAVLAVVFASTLLTMVFLKGDARVRLSFDPVIFALAAGGWTRLGGWVVGRARGAGAG